MDTWEEIEKYKDRRAVLHKLANEAAAPVVQADELSEIATCTMTSHQVCDLAARNAATRWMEMEMDDPIISSTDSAVQSTTYNDLIRTASTLKVEKDATPINPDPIIAAADAAQTLNIEKAAEVRSAAAIDEHQLEPSFSRVDKTVQRNRALAPNQPSSSVMGGDVDPRIIEQPP